GGRRNDTAVSERNYLLLFFRPFHAHFTAPPSSSLSISHRRETPSDAGIHIRESFCQNRRLPDRGSRCRRCFFPVHREKLPRLLPVSLPGARISSFSHSR